MLRLLVVDDHEVVRTGLRQMLKGRVDMEVAGEARTGAEAIAAVRREHFHVVLVDLSLSDLSGVDVLARIRALRPETAVLVVSGYPEEQYAISLLRSGAAGFVSKESLSENLVPAVLAAAQGRRFVSARVADRLARALSGRVADEPAHARLSVREFQIFRKLACGEAATRIAAELFLSAKTVSSYRSRILEKMQFRSNADITCYAVRNGLIA